jgi:hypothetical protein
MAALSVLNPTLLDLARASDPNGKVEAVVEILNETNEMLADMTWLEGNLVTGHRASIRTGLPAPTWRKIGGGVQPNKGLTAQVVFNTGSLWAYAEIDKSLADLNGNTSAFRLLEDRAHIEGMNQEIADTLMYGNDTLEPEAFTGFTPHYNSVVVATAASADNVIDAAGTGTDNGSIWLVVWSPNTIHGIVPKGSKAGIQVTDKGLVTIEDASAGSNSGRMEAYRSVYQWDAGLVVKDWRYAVRIANIDKSNLTLDAASGANLPDLMFQAIRRIPNLNAGRAVFYMSRDMLTFVGRQQTNWVRSGTLPVDMVGGKIVQNFHGIPCRRVDPLAADEARVV